MGPMKSTSLPGPTILLKEVDFKQVHKQMYNVTADGNSGLSAWKQGREIGSEEEIIVF